jgi:hypothetical protein
MRREDFEQMSVGQVMSRARVETPVQRGKPLYYDRPWSQVLDEMDHARVRTVGALDPTRVEALHEGVSGGP